MRPVWCACARRGRRCACGRGCPRRTSALAERRDVALRVGGLLRQTAPRHCEMPRLESIVLAATFDELWLVTRASSSPALSLSGAWAQTAPVWRLDWAAFFSIVRRRGGPSAFPSDTLRCRPRGARRIGDVWVPRVNRRARWNGNTTKTSTCQLPVARAH